MHDGRVFYVDPNNGTIFYVEKAEEASQQKNITILRKNSPNIRAMKVYTKNTIQGNVFFVFVQTIQDDHVNLTYCKIL